MKSFLSATAILLAVGAAPALAEPNSGSGAGTAGTAANAQKSPDYDSTAADRRKAAGKGGAAGSNARTMSQGPNGTPGLHDGADDNGQGSYRAKTPP